MESNAASHQAYNDDTIVDQTMGSPLNRSVFGSIIDKQRTSSNYNPMREQELEQELEHEEMVQKEFDELKGEAKRGAKDGWSEATVKVTYYLPT